MNRKFSTSPCPRSENADRKSFMKFSLRSRGKMSARKTNKATNPDETTAQMAAASNPRQRGMGLIGGTAGWLGIAAAILLGNMEAGAQVISRVSAPGKFYVDDKASIGIVYNYAAYVVSNNTATIL